MGRWDLDDARDGYSSENRSGRDRGSIHDRAVVEPLPDRLPERPIEPGGRREHSLLLPTGPDREAVHLDARTVHLHGSEVDVLERAARFRVTLTADLKADAGSTARAGDDVRSLVRQGLLAQRTITRLQDGSQASVVSATAFGQRLLDTHRDSARDRDQVYYSGWVKPREAWHDAQLFRMVRTVERELEREGAKIRRVVPGFGRPTGTGTNRPAHGCRQAFNAYPAVMIDPNRRKNCSITAHDASNSAETGGLPWSSLL